MSFPAQNLHEFVLKLMTDDAARSAFAADPTAVLADAGLSDVTPEDIQQVAPLVTEYAPELSDLGTDAPSLADLPVSTDYLGDVEGFTAGSVDGAAGAIAYHGEELQAGGTATISADGIEPTGALATPLGSVEGALTATTGSADGVLTTDSALGTYTLSTDGAPVEAADLATSLDSEFLDRTAPAAGTVASFVSNGGDVLGNGVDTGADTLGGYLTDAGAQAGATVSGGGDALSEHVAQASEAGVGELAHPALPALPALPAVPEVPAVQALPTPTDLPNQLPLHVDADVPHSLPHLPVANPLPEIEHVAAPVTDVVSQSPLGDAAATLDHTAALTEIGDLGDHLPFAH